MSRDGLHLIKHAWDQAAHHIDFIKNILSSLFPLKLIGFLQCNPVRVFAKCESCCVQWGLPPSTWDCSPPGKPEWEPFKF